MLQIFTLAFGIGGSISQAIVAPESPRWLVSVRKFDQAREAFAQIAFYNKFDSKLAYRFRFKGETISQ